MKTIPVIVNLPLQCPSEIQAVKAYQNIVRKSTGRDNGSEQAINFVKIALVSNLHEQNSKTLDLFADAYW